MSQVVIARLYFTRWSKRLTPFWSATTLWILSLIWACCVINLVAQNTPGHLWKWSPAVFRGIVYEIGTTWGITSAASLLLVYAVRWVYAGRWVYAVRGIGALSGDAAPEFSPGRRAVLKTAAAVPFVGVAFGGIVERTNFHVKEIDLPVQNLHPDLEGFRIVQISDLHVSPFLSVRDAGRVVDMANELNAHLAVMTGDLISEAGDPLDETIRELARLRADNGVLGCLGNHELVAGCQTYTTTESARFGIQFLRSRARLVRRGNALLNVAGVDYQTLKNKHIYLPGAEKLVVPGATNLLLSHNPDVFPVAMRQGYDTMLAGHTHGGQVTIEIINQTANFARFVTPYVCGLYRLNQGSCYVTPGIGTIGMPVRLGARPEVSLLRLKKA